MYICICMYDETENERVSVECAVSLWTAHCYHYRQTRPDRSADKQPGMASG